MTSYRTKQGFTLIELLLVLTIMGVALGLVGSFSVQQFERTEARSEELKLRNFMINLSNRAFATAREHRLTIEGKRLDVYIDGEKLRDMSFDYLFFQPQELVIVSTGTFSDPSIEYQARARNMSLNLVTYETNEVSSE